MQRRVVAATLAVAALMAVATSLSIAAAAKQYQFTGNVADVDTKSKVIRVDKDGDVWEFSYEGLKEMPVKKGDRVTVSYSMTAKKLEVKKKP